MSTKIILIGAGSAMFTRGLVADLILSPDLGPWKLGLVDISPEALETAEGLCRKMIGVRDVDIEVEASTDRRDVLPVEQRESFGSPAAGVFARAGFCSP